MRINVSYSEKEEEDVRKLVEHILHSFPQSSVKRVSKTKYHHAYIDTAVKHPGAIDNQT